MQRAKEMAGVEDGAEPLPDASELKRDGGDVQPIVFAVPAAKRVKVEHGLPARPSLLSRGSGVQADDEGDRYRIWVFTGNVPN